MENERAFQNINNILSGQIWPRREREMPMIKLSELLKRSLGTLIQSSSSSSSISMHKRKQRGRDDLQIKNSGKKL